MKAFLLSRLISQACGQYTIIATSIYMLEVVKVSASQLSVFFGFYAVGSIAFGWLGGKFIDKFSARLMLGVSEVLLGVCLFLIVHTHNFVLLCILEAFFGLFTGIATAAIISIVPKLVEQEKFAKLNATFTLLDSFAFIFGAISAKIVIDNFSYKIAFYVDGITYIIAASSLIFLNNQVRKIQINKIKVDIPDMPKKSYSEYFFNKKLLMARLFNFGPWLMMASMGALEALYLKEDLKINLTNLAYIQLSFGLGLLVAGLAIRKLSLTLNSEEAMVIALALSGIFGVLYIATPLFIISLIAIFLWGMVWQYMDASVRTFIQLNTKEEIIGRVSSVHASLSSFMKFPSALLLVVLLSRTSVATTVFVLGAIAMLVALYGQISISRQRSNT